MAFTSRRAQSALAAAVIGVLAMPACFEPSLEARRHKVELEVQVAEMNETLNTLEERMLGSQANVQLWQEMARRHKSVSAVACESASGHVQQMAAVAAKSRQKNRAMRRLAKAQLRAKKADSQL